MLRALPPTFARSGRNSTCAWASAEKGNRVQETHPQAPSYAPASHKRRRLLRRWRGKLCVAACQLALLAALLGLGLWQGATPSQALSFLFGSPSEIWSYLVKMQQDGSLVHDATVTGTETL